MPEPPEPPADNGAGELQALLRDRLALAHAAADAPHPPPGAEVAVSAREAAVRAGKLVISEAPVRLRPLGAALPEQPPPGRRDPARSFAERLRFGAPRRRHGRPRRRFDAPPRLRPGVAVALVVAVALAAFLGGLLTGRGDLGTGSRRRTPADVGGLAPQLRRSLARFRVAAGGFSARPGGAPTAGATGLGLFALGPPRSEAEAAALSRDLAWLAATALPRRGAAVVAWSQPGERETWDAAVTARVVAGLGALGPARSPAAARLLHAALAALRPAAAADGGWPTTVSVDSLRTPVRAAESSSLAASVEVLAALASLGAPSVAAGMRDSLLAATARVARGLSESGSLPTERRGRVPLPPGTRSLGWCALVETDRTFSDGWPSRARTRLRSALAGRSLVPGRLPTAPRELGAGLAWLAGAPTGRLDRSALVWAAVEADLLADRSTARPAAWRARSDVLDARVVREARRLLASLARPTTRGGPSVAQAAALAWYAAQRAGR